MLDALKADEDKPDCEKYKEYYEREVAPYYDADHQIKTYFDLTYDDTSVDFQSGIVGGGYPISIAYNSEENYVFLYPLTCEDKDFSESYNNALRDCFTYGRKPCYDYEDYKSIASELIDDNIVLNEILFNADSFFNGYYYYPNNDDNRN